MLLANVTVAEKIIESKKRGVFRIHDKPDEKKIAEIDSFIKKLGYRINISNSKEPNKTINKLLELIEGKPEKNIIDMMVIRAMSKAKYSSKNIGHFGLMFENYTHFTSPIRRYPDLIVHRLINDIINKKKYHYKWFRIFVFALQHYGRKSNKSRKSIYKINAGKIYVRQSWIQLWWCCFRN